MKFYINDEGSGTNAGSTEGADNSDSADNSNSADNSKPCCYDIFSHFRENIHIVMKFYINLIFFRTKDYPHERYILPYHANKKSV